ncbi:hypothetical protein [uncultured Fibrella sp.]|uniref:hypothetical protein n=1 Tax=uncultured Fibrella sp. TaxID=1284596 RepID=UPI0035CC53A8
MPKHIRKWLISIGLNLAGLLLSLGLLYVAAVVVVLQVSVRAATEDPLFGIINFESLLVLVVSLVAIGLVFRCSGKIYALLISPPKPD